MEYVQERVPTLHALTDHQPNAPTDRAAVVVPMTAGEHRSPAAERVFSTLEAVDPARVIVPLRAGPSRAPEIADWLHGFDLTIEPLWCDGPRLAAHLASNGLDGRRGKGRDVWLGLGRALSAPYVIVHDADTQTYTTRFVNRLLFPLAHGYTFSKGYYARVEETGLYGRLFRLFVRPLLRALASGPAGNAPVIAYLESFRYALAGEFAATNDLLEQVRVQRGWGLEIGTLGEAFTHAGFTDSAQVDLGRYEHDHRSVDGPTGLADMSEAVAAATFRVLDDHDVDVDYDTLPDRYRTVANRLIDAYGADATFNGLAYDPVAERSQVDTYADAIHPPGPDTRLPSWRTASIDPDDVAAAARADLEAAREHPEEVVSHD